MDDLVVSPELKIPAGELRWRFDTAGGPGGQHANRSATRAELSFDVAGSKVLDDSQRDRLLASLGERLSDGVLTVQVGSSRSQWRNRQLARRQMAETLRAALAPPPPLRRRTRPGRAARERRLADKRAVSEKKRLRRRPYPD